MCSNFFPIAEYSAIQSSTLFFADIGNTGSFFVRYHEQGPLNEVANVFFFLRKTMLRSWCEPSHRF